MRSHQSIKGAYISPPICNKRLILLQGGFFHPFCSEYAFQYHNFTNLNFVTSHFSYLLCRLHELIISSGKIMGANLLRLATSLAKGFSQVYILMTLIPEMISFITLMRSSVRAAILDLKKN